MPSNAPTWDETTEAPPKWDDTVGPEEFSKAFSASAALGERASRMLNDPAAAAASERGQTLADIETGLRPTAPTGPFGEIHPMAEAPTPGRALTTGEAMLQPLTTLSTPIAKISPSAGDVIRGSQVALELGANLPEGSLDKYLGAPPTDEQADALTKRSKLLAASVGGTQAAADMASFFTSPIGIASLGIGTLPAAAQRAVALGFAAQMAAQMPEEARALGTEFGKPEGERDNAKIARMIAGAAGTMGFTATSALHGLKPAPDLPMAGLQRFVSRDTQGPPTPGEMLRTPPGAPVPRPEPAPPIERATPEQAAASADLMQREATTAMSAPRPGRPTVPEGGVEPAAQPLTKWQDFVSSLAQNGTGKETLAQIKEMFAQQWPDMEDRTAAALAKNAFGPKWPGFGTKWPKGQPQPIPVRTQPPPPPEEPPAEAGAPVPAPTAPTAPAVPAAETPPVPVEEAGTVTLYTGKGGAGGAGQGESWFTGNIEKARSYGPEVKAVQVPKDVAEAAKAAAQQQGQGGDTYFLKREFADKAKPVTAPPEKIHEVGAGDTAAATDFAKQSRWTFKPQAGLAPTAEELAAMPEADRAEFQAIQESNGWEFTDYREGSPTKGNTFYTKVGATAEEIQTAFRAHLAKEKPKATAKAPALPEPAKDWDAFYEELVGDLDSFNPARSTGKIDYALQDVAQRFVDYAKADKSGQPIDALVSEFAKADEASPAQIQKLRQSVKNATPKPAEAAPAPATAPSGELFATPEGPRTGPAARAYIVRRLEEFEDIDPVTGEAFPKENLTEAQEKAWKKFRSMLADIEKQAVGAKPEPPVAKSTPPVAKPAPTVPKPAPPVAKPAEPVAGSPEAIKAEFEKYRQELAKQLPKGSAGTVFLKDGQQLLVSKNVGAQAAKYPYRITRLLKDGTPAGHETFFNWKEVEHHIWSNRRDITGIKPAESVKAALPKPPVIAPTPKLTGAHTVKDALGHEFEDIGPRSEQLDKMREEKAQAETLRDAIIEKVKDLKRRIADAHEAGKGAEAESLIEEHDTAAAEGQKLVARIEELAASISDERRRLAFAPFRGQPEPEPAPPKITAKVLKTQRENLLSQVEQSLKGAPETAKEGDKIQFSVPGDGDWTINNSKEALKKFRDLVAKEFPDSVSRAAGAGPKGPAKGRAIPKALEPDAEDLPQLGASVVSQDATRLAIQTAYADGQQIVSTDGRQMLRIVSDKAPGSLQSPVRLDEKGKVVSGEGDYPNFNMIQDPDAKLVYGGLKTDELWHVARQAQVFAKSFDRAEMSLQLLINKDRSLGARMTQPGGETFEYNYQPGGHDLGGYNADYLFTAADVARRLGNEVVDLYFHSGDSGPIEIAGKNSQHLIMGMKKEGEGAALRDKPESFLNVSQRAVHGRHPLGLGPARNPEGTFTSATFSTAGDKGKWSVMLEAGTIKIQRKTGTDSYSTWYDTGSISVADLEKLKGTSRTDAISKASGATVQETRSSETIKRIGEAIKEVQRDRQRVIEENQKRASLIERAVKSLESAAAEAKARLKSRGTTFGSGPLHELPNIRDYALIGAAKLARATLDFGKWSAEMVKEFGERIRPHLTKLYAMSQEIARDYRSGKFEAEGKTQELSPVQQLIARVTGAGTVKPGTDANVLDTLATSLRTVRALKEHFTGNPQVPRSEVKAADDWLEGDATRIKQSLTELVNRELPPDERGRFITAINNASRRAPILTGDPEGMYRRAAQVAARILDRSAEVKKGEAIDFLKKAVNRALQSPTVDVGYKRRIVDLMQRVSFTKPTADTIAALKATREYLARMEAQGKNVELPREILDKLEVLSKVPLRDMPPEAVNALANQVAALENLGRLKVKSRQAAWDAEKNAKIRELNDEETSVLEKRPELRQQPGDPRPLSIKLRNFLNQRLNTATLIDKALMPIDALFDMLGDAKGTYRGWLFRHVRGPIDLGFNAAQVMRDRLEQASLDIIKKHNMGEREAERIGVFAIANQDGGIERMVEMGVLPETINNILKTLSAQEKQVYIEMRKALDETFPQIQRMMHELYNIDVQPVENYFPMPRDWSLIEKPPVIPNQPSFGSDFSFDELAAWHDLLGDYRSPRTIKTERGFTVERKPQAMTPIKVNAFDVFHQHLNDVTYLLNTQREIKMIGEMAKGELFQQKYGKLGQILVLDWLDTVARQGRLGGFRRIPWLDNLRTRTSAGVIGFRLASNFVHLSNAALGVHRAGGIANFNAGLMDVVTGRATQFLKDNFAETYARGGGEPAYVEAAAKDVSVFGKTVVPKSVVSAGFAIARRIDQWDSQATVLGAYFRALKEKGLDPRNYLDMPVDKEAQARALVLTRRAVASPLNKDVPMALSRGAVTGGNISLGRTILQFQNIFLDQWSNIRHDLWRAGIREKNPKLAAEMVVSLAAMLMAETMIRETAKAAIGAMTGDHPKKEENVKAKIATEVVRRFPFGGQLTTQLLYGETGIPIIDSVVGVSRAAKQAATAKTDLGQTRGMVKLGAGAAQLFGVPGASQAGELVEKSL